MAKRVVYLLFVFSFLLMPSAFAYQFRDYTWGTPQEEIKERLIKESIEVTAQRNALSYKDKIFNMDCQVVFLFTLGSRRLCNITLTWNNTAIGAKLKEELTKKYGEPQRHNPYTDEYVWAGPIEGKSDDLDLDYNYGDTRLEYYGEGYFKEYQKELTNVFLAKNGYGPNKPARRPYIIMELEGGRRWK
jgi:hypothetical protein